MALIEASARTSTTYLTIAEGFLCQRSKEPREGYVTRQTSTGKTVHERRFEAIEGKVNDVSSKQTEWGRKWTIDLQDGAECYLLTMDYDSAYAKYIINALLSEAFDRSQPVMIKPYYFTDKNTGKQKKGATVSQNGQKLEWRYGRDDMPQMVQVVVKGEKVWDDTEQLAFLQDKVDAAFGITTSTNPF